MVEFVSQATSRAFGFSKIMVLVALVLASWLTLDFVSRTNAGGELLKNVEHSPSELKPLKDLSVSAELKQQINEAYLKYKVEKDGSDVSDIEKPEVELDSTTLMLQGKRLSLKAIVKLASESTNSPNRYALVSVADDESGNNEIKRLFQNDVLFGHKLDIINERQVNFTAVEVPSSGQVNNSVHTLYMYRPAADTTTK